MEAEGVRELAERGGSLEDEVMFVEDLSRVE